MPGEDSAQFDWLVALFLDERELLRSREEGLSV